MSYEQTDAYGKFTDKFKMKLSGTDYGFTKEGCAFTRTVGGERVFGSAFLLSGRNEAERREAERRELSGKELELLRRLG